jgi:hypothetical protein
MKFEQPKAKTDGHGEVDLLLPWHASNFLMPKF